MERKILPGRVAFWRRLAKASVAAFVLAACPECIGGVLDTGDEAIERRNERDDRFEQAEPGSEQRY